MYMYDIKLFAKNEKESETQIQSVRIYREDIGMEWGSTSTWEYWKPTPWNKWG